MMPDMRPLVEKLLDVVEDIYCRKREKKAVVLEAPTGYGKTFAAPFVAQKLFDCDYADRFLHVLPLRAIVEDVLRNEKSGLLARIERGELRLRAEDVAYQMGERLEGVPKRPLFDARYVVSTLDSFLYNFYKIPVTEIFRPKKHYAIPRLRIFLSGIFFDEAHVALGESCWSRNPPSAGSLVECEEGLYSATLAFLEAAVKAGVPVVLASATMGAEALKRVAPYSHVVKYGKGGRRGDIEEIYDEDFAEKVRSVKWRTGIIEDEKVVEKALEVVNQGRRVFVAVDNIPRAVKYYRGLKDELGEDVVLLHGALTRGDRAEGLEKLGRAKALVATSVVEAGVDVSFDVLITDGWRPRSVVQRAGRVCRRLDCGEAELYLIKIKEFTDDLVADYVNEANCINWRNPLDEDGCKGYGALLDKAPLPEGKEVHRFSTLASPLFVASSTLDAILEAREYALFRTALVTVFVDTCNGQEVCIKAEEAVKRSITLDSDRLRAVAKCVKGFYAIDDGGARRVCGKRVDVKSYVRCLKAAYEQRPRDAADIIAGFVLKMKSEDEKEDEKKECYEPGIGLMPLVNP